jgi:hypothetical protein
MKKLTILFTILLCAFFAGSCGKKADDDAAMPDREPLIRLMNQYLEAVVKHDPAGLPLAADVKLVENITPTPVGEGLWKTATGGPGKFKVYVSDPVSGQIAFLGVIESEGKPRLLSARLKVVNGRITEIDHMVSSLGMDGGVPDTLIAPREGLVTKLTPAERVPRGQMIKAAMGYYEAIEFSDGTLAPFADECSRHENGMATSNNQQSKPAADPKPADAFSAFMAAIVPMKCGEQLSTGNAGYITKMNQRRVAAVDEEMGLVMIFSMMNHDGEPNPLPVRNVPGITEIPNTWGQFTVPAMHLYKVKNGLVYEIETNAIVGVPYQASDGWTCTRKCLTDIMDNYLAALPKHDASSLPLAAGVKIVENGEAIDTGKGLWQTATGGPTSFKIYAADPDRGEIGFLGVIEENKKPTIAAVRIRIADGRIDGKITEIDHLVVHDDQPLNANMSKLRPTFLERLPKLQRVNRDKMLEAANSYYDSILQSDGTVSPFADSCQRRENGMITANDPAPDPKSDMAVFGKMKCGEQLSTGVMGYITDINDRRLFAVDEELGLVMAFSVFRHDGKPEVMKITGVPGVTERTNSFGAFDLPAAHVYKIRSGKLDEIEAIGYMSDTGFKNGW